MTTPSPATNSSERSTAATAADKARMPKRRRTPVLLGAVVVILIVVAIVAWGATSGGWFKPKSSNGGSCPSNPQALTGAGSTFVYPLMNTWTAQYAQQCNVDVNYQPVGSSTGITSLGSKAVDFGASDAPLSPVQRASLPGPTVTIPETSGGVVLLYNLPSVLGTVQLSGPVIAAMYLGTITNWNDTRITSLNPGLSIPSTPVLTVHRLDGSGTSFCFTSYLSAENSTWASEYGRGLSVGWPGGEGAKGSTGVAGIVGSIVGAIGYDEFAYAQLNHLTSAAIQNSVGNFIVANQTNVQMAVQEGASALPSGTGDWYNVSLLNEPGAQTYPIVTFSYVMLFTDLNLVYGSSITSTDADSLGHFLYWILTSGQSYASGVFYVPLPANVVSADELSLGQITYNGAPISTH
ncbi:MAG TPA: phosphate ABC transporter substrate-binding protein PstS [Thermoplasmata archaeon]|jgi:phosphate transport system substrate-binding protein|nr:phosphate ABC transporter substrate-binding protein PstS [Thermoplasmata archaeon]